MQYSISFYRRTDAGNHEHITTEQLSSNGITQDMPSIYEEVNADQSALADKAEELADQINDEFNMEIRERIEELLESCIEHVLDEADVTGNVKSDNLFDFAPVGGLNIPRLSDRIIDKLTEEYEYKVVFDDGLTMIVIVVSDDKVHGRMIITRVGD